jgi:hypothetical protein
MTGCFKIPVRSVFAGESGTKSISKGFSSQKRFIENVKRTLCELAMCRMQGVLYILADFNVPSLFLHEALFATTS